MSALRLARAYTGRNKIIKFSGCYHGHADMLLVQAGSGVATMGLPDSPGVPAETTSNTLIAPYNDSAAVEALFQTYPAGDCRHHCRACRGQYGSGATAARTSWKSLRKSDTALWRTPDF